MTCIAPSDIFVNEAAKIFGAVAEALIQKDYLQHVGRTAFFPAGQHDFIDISHGFGNAQLYSSFLKARHPNLSGSELAVMSEDALMKIPDIMTSDPPTRTEFYEIKPASDSGRRAGREKVGAIDAARQSLNLPYTRGTTFPASGDKLIKVYNARPFGARIEVFLKYTRIEDGLLTYEICVDGEVDKLGLHLLLLLLAALLIVLAAQLAVPVVIAVPVVLH